MKRKILLTFIILITCAAGSAFAQTTGKIAGTVFDAQSGEPLPGANVLVTGTSLGASVGLDGSFFILNVAPGTYELSIEMLGYKTVKVEDVRVSVNRTAYLEITLESEVLEGDVIVVQASKIATKKDQTSSMRAISSDQIDILPVENVGAVISMQAGVVNGHFRGGRSNEVSYMVDGLPVDELFGGEGSTVDLEPESISDLEVITGTFNAEYGRAMSGVVNAVVKDGGDKLSGSVSVNSGTYLTSNDDIFIGLGEVDMLRNQDYKVNLSGSLLPGKLYFFTNARFQDNKNHLNGIRRFNVDDYSDYSGPEGTWLTQHTGDNSFVPMNNSLNTSLLGKLTYKFSDEMKVSLLYTRNDDEWNGYDHSFKYNPDGLPAAFRETDMYSMQLNQSLGLSAFYQFNLSYVNNFNGYYLFDNPLDARYVHDGYLRSTEDIGFFTGGQVKTHNERTLEDYNAKFDLTWQINNKHAIKTGFHYIFHRLDNRESAIRNELFAVQDGEELRANLIDGTAEYIPEILPPTSSFTDAYTVEPTEVAAYIQDKMEYQDMVINLGLRFDYFDPNTVYPSDPRNPGNQLEFADSLSQTSSYPKAEKKIQVSPRLGLAYQLGDKAVLRFSYGHFFQMPPLYALYQNSNFLVAPSDFATTMGNAQIKAQKTVQYEMGLWQELFDGFGLELALFYRDIYNLLSAKVVTTYNQVEYGLYTNKDYGNAKGLEVKVDYRLGEWAAFLNYTLQYTRGNADNPTQTFSRAGSNIDPVNKLIVMSWDQRHTLNATVGYYKPQWGLTFTGYYNSGAPYTWSPLGVSTLADLNLPPNNDYRPAQVSLDMTAFYKMRLSQRFGLQFDLSVFNVLDALNEVAVNSQSGRAYTDVVEPSELASHKEDFNTYYDRIQNPSQYSAPRYVKFGVGLTF